MKTGIKAYVGALIHDGKILHQGQALVVDSGGGMHVQPPRDLPVECALIQLNGGIITPGFVDLQVNGGGGVMFNDAPSVDTLRTIAAAHAALGTTALLPTLITDTPQRTRDAILAVEQAIQEHVAGIVGIHLEGPHLSVARKGAHDPELIRPMEEADLQLMLDAAQRLPDVMITVAPENVTLDQIRQMSEAGIIVSLGHTDADFDTCLAAFRAGATCVTHLFNAMRQINGRDPGVVGAALACENVFVGLIADGIHVHPANIRTALAAGRAGERLFLVTDAMATTGSQIESFRLNGRAISRADGRLTLADGTLAGADLELPRAIEVMTRQAEDALGSAIARVTSVPAQLLGKNAGLGRLTGAPGTTLYFSDGMPGPVTTLENINVPGQEHSAS